MLMLQSEDLLFHTVGTRVKEWCHSLILGVDTLLGLSQLIGLGRCWGFMFNISVLVMTDFIEMETDDCSGFILSFALCELKISMVAKILTNNVL